MTKLPITEEELAPLVPKKPRVSSRGRKEKGAQFERELAAHLNHNLGINSARAKITTPFYPTGGVGMPDLVGTPLLSIEAKRTEALDYRKALAQARRNSSGGDLPVVISRKNKEQIDDSICFMRLSDFIKLYKKALLSHGFPSR